MAGRGRPDVPGVRRASLAVMLVMALSAGVFAFSGSASAETSAVQGSAYGYYTYDIALFESPQPNQGPAPTVTLASDASNSPQDASVASAEAAYGPAVLFRSGPIDVHTEGALGADGYATSSSNVQGAPPDEQVDPFHYDNVFGTCTATEAGVTADVTITNGFIVTTTEPEPVPVPTNPEPGYTVEGTVPGANDNFRIVFNEQVTNPDGSLAVNAAHMYLLGPTATGHLIIGQSVCGVTVTAPTTTTTTTVPTTTPTTTTTTTVPPTKTAVPSPGDPDVVRLWGDSRITTAIALSQHTRPGGAAAVVLARADAYPDALAGAPLAAQLDAPILLTGGGALDPAVAAEIDRLRATGAYLLGGTGALSPQVEADLRARGIGDITRLAGASRFETAARIGERVVGSRVGQVPVYVVEGANADPARGWPDAVSVSGLAALHERPILLVTRDRLPDETRAALGALGVTVATVVGGPAAVSDQVAAAVADHDGDGDTDIAVTRLSGVTRYDTSRAVADQSVADGADPALTWFATGRNYPDALAAGPAVGDSGGVLLLLDGQGLDGSPPARAWLTEHRSRFTLIRLVGGPAAISTEVEEEIRATVGA